MTELFPFFIVLIAGLFFAGVFRRFHLPWVISLIIGGIIIGPHGTNIFATNDTIEFLGEIGLIFLMFMAGFETKLSTFKKLEKEISIATLFNGGVPLLIGLAIGRLLGLDWNATFLLGVIFISSSIAVIIPYLESSHLFKTKLGKMVVGTAIFQDITSLVLLSIFLQSSGIQTSIIPLPLFYIILLGLLIGIRWVIRKLISTFYVTGDQEDVFQRELRIIVAILIGTVVMFEILGLHPIIAAFFAGVVLSELTITKTIKIKLRTLGYGIFIPIFFILIGAKTDISVFTTNSDVAITAIIIISAAILGKLISGIIAGKILNFNWKESAFIGVSTIPLLSTTLAISFSGLELGIITPELATVLVALSVVTTLVSPLLMQFIRLPKEA